MNNYDDFIRADEWVPVMLDMLKAGRKLRISPTGFSMYPFLVSKRDEVILIPADRKELQKGDICLYRRDDSLHVLHRLHHITDDGYYMLGDSQTWIEGPLRRDQILAVAESIIRKGRQISCDSRKYLFLYRLWMKIRPLRPAIIWCWRKLRLLNRKKRQEDRANRAKNKA